MLHYFLQKAYKALFDKSSGAQKGTLYYFKVLLRRKDVTGNVKSNFKAHWDLLMTVGEHMIMEQVMEFFGMDTPASQPTKNKPPQDIESGGKDIKHDYAKKILLSFLKLHGYGTLSLQEPPKPAVQPETSVIRTTYQVLGRTTDGKILVIPVQQTVPAAPKAPDAMQNSCHNLCHWVLQLVMMDDTAKEGDVDRLLLNTKYNLPFFFSHSARSKYFVENMDFTMKAQHILSPSVRMRILEGCFLNIKGGKGRNVEADLVQEHSVRNRKDLIRQLGANKTDQAIARVTNAADSIAAMGNSFDAALRVVKSGGRHTKRVSEADHNKISEELRLLRPFHTTPGRICEGFPSIPKCPFDKIDRQKMETYLIRNIRRITIGQAVPVDDDDDGEENDDQADEDGAAEVVVTGGTEPFNYTWSNGATTSVASGLGPIQHTVTVTDANGCSTTASITVTEDIVPLAVSIEQQQDILSLRLSIPLMPDRPLTEFSVCFTSRRSTR